MDEKVIRKVSEEKDWTVLSLTGRLDRITSPVVGEKAEELLAACCKFAIDVTDLEYLSSAGIRILLRLAKKAKAAQKSFAICGAKGFVQDVLEDSNMNVLVMIFPNRERLG